MPRDAEGLRPKLERAQETLQHALSQACETNLNDADTGELIRLEEVLAIANEAAKEAVSVRRRLGRERERAADSHDPNAAGAHREFEDERGVRWLAFAVHPVTTSSADRAALRAQFRDGWLAFDSGLETRRLAPIPANWQTCTAAELNAMCAQAQPAMRRLPREHPPGAAQGPAT